jgi:hypothetical protein
MSRDNRAAGIGYRRGLSVCPLPLNLSHSQAADLGWLTWVAGPRMVAGARLPGNPSHFGTEWRGDASVSADCEHVESMCGELDDFGYQLPGLRRRAPGRFLAPSDACRSSCRKQRKSCLSPSMTASGWARLRGQSRWSRFSLTARRPARWASGRPFTGYRRPSPPRPQAPKGGRRTLAGTRTCGYGRVPAAPRATSLAPTTTASYLAGKASCAPWLCSPASPGNPGLIVISRAV